MANTAPTQEGQGTPYSDIPVPTADNGTFDLSKVTQDDINFIEGNDLEFTPVDNNQSTKSNIFIIWKNLDLLLLFLKNLKKFVYHFYQSMNIEELIKGIIDTLTTSKNSVLIDYSIDIPEKVENGVYFTTEKVNGKTYQVTRKDEYQVEITCLESEPWITDNLIIQVKNLEGTVVNPVITTASNTVKLYFVDGISTNYRMFWL